MRILCLAISLLCLAFAFVFTWRHEPLTALVLYVGSAIFSTGGRSETRDDAIERYGKALRRIEDIGVSKRGQAESEMYWTAHNALNPRPRPTFDGGDSGQKT